MAVGPATAAALLDALGDYPARTGRRRSRAGDLARRALWAADPPRASTAAPAGHAGHPQQHRGGSRSPDACTWRRPTTRRRPGRWLIEAAQLRAVLVKGGHLGAPAETVVRRPGDRFEAPSAFQPSAAPRVRAPGGTGCALASAIAVKLGSGPQLVGRPSVTPAPGWRASSRRPGHRGRRTSFGQTLGRDFESDHRRALGRQEAHRVGRVVVAHERLPRDETLLAQMLGLPADRSVDARTQTIPFSGFRSTRSSTTQRPSLPVGEIFLRDLALAGVRIASPGVSKSVLP